MHSSTILIDSIQFTFAIRFAVPRFFSIFLFFFFLLLFYFIRVTHTHTPIPPHTVAPLNRFVSMLDFHVSASKSRISPVTGQKWRGREGENKVLCGGKSEGKKNKKEGSSQTEKREGEKQEKITRYTASGEEKSGGRVAVNQREISKKLAERGEKGGDVW